VANLLSEKKKSSSISQVIGKNPTGIQVGGNFTVNEKDKK
jgi:hypothetical protein